MAHDKQGGFSRRSFIKGAAAGAATVAAGGPVAAKGRDDDKHGHRSMCDGARDLNLVHGRFLTMDADNSVASAVAIRDGRIVEVGRPGDLGPCSRTINLKGATVIPGLIDSSVHFTRAGTNPGYETRSIETAFSIAELQKVIAERAETVPPGGFITAQGGWSQNQFAELLLPTKAELDAATSTRGVYLNGRTNTVGAAFFASFGISVDAVTGQVSNATAATNALRSIQTFEDKVRGTADLIAFAAANGLTSCHDPSNLTVQPDDYAVMNTLYHRSGRSTSPRLTSRPSWRIWIRSSGR